MDVQQSVPFCCAFIGRGSPGLTVMPRALSRLELHRILEDASLRSERDAALIATTFLTAGRISEVLAVRYSDVALVEEDVLVVRMPVLKRKKEIWKMIPIVREDPFSDYMWDYVLASEGPERIWPIDRTTAWRICRRYGFHPHELRHSRLTELSQFMTEDVLKSFAGWKIKSMAGYYLHHGWYHFLPFVRKAAELARRELGF